MNNSPIALYKILIVAIASVFVFGIDVTIMNVALPNIMSQFNISTDHAQLIVTAYSLACAISTPAVAFLIERFGVKYALIIGQAGFLAGSILCAVAWNSDALVVFRVIQGLSAGLILPSALTMLVVYVPYEKRSTAMSIVGLSVMIGPAIGPVLGGYLLTNWNWRMCFYINIPILIIALILTYLWLRKTETSPKKFDLWGFALAGIGFSSILYALSNAPTWHWNDWRVITLLAVGFTSLVIWVIKELRHDHPLLDLRVFKNRSFTLALIIWAIFIPTYQVVIFLLPLFLQNLRRLDAMQTGILILPICLGSMIAMPISTKLYSRFGPRVPVVLGLIIMTITGIWLQNIDTSTSDSILMWMMLLRGVGNGLCLMPLMTHALSCVTEKMSAQASTMISVVQMLSASIFIALFISAMDYFQKTELAVITQTTTMDSPMVLSMLSQVQVMFMQAGQSAQAAYSAGISLLYQYCQLRSTVFSFQRDFFLVTVQSLLLILPSLMLPRGRTNKPEGDVIVA